MSVESSEDGEYMDSSQFGHVLKQYFIDDSAQGGNMQPEQKQPIQINSPTVREISQ